MRGSVSKIPGQERHCPGPIEITWAREPVKRPWDIILHINTFPLNDKNDFHRFFHTCSQLTPPVGRLHSVLILVASNSGCRINVTLARSSITQWPGIQFPSGCTSRKVRRELQAFQMLPVYFSFRNDLGVPSRILSDTVYPFFRMVLKFLHCAI